MDATKLTKELADEDLAALNDAVTAEVRNRQPKATIEMIRPGMSKEDEAMVLKAIIDARKGR